VNKELAAVEERELINYVRQGKKRQTIKDLFLKSINKLGDQTPPDPLEKDELKIKKNKEELGDTSTEREGKEKKKKKKTKKKKKKKNKKIKKKK
ncbi:hypothetical protein D9O40_21910, partial [Clostridium autoethanogenum]